MPYSKQFLTHKYVLLTSVRSLTGVNSALQNQAQFTSVSVLGIPSKQLIVRCVCVHMYQHYIYTLSYVKCILVQVLHGGHCYAALATKPLWILRNGGVHTELRRAMKHRQLPFAAYVNQWCRSHQSQRGMHLRLRHEFVVSASALFYVLSMSIPHQLDRKSLKEKRESNGSGLPLNSWWWKFQNKITQTSQIRSYLCIFVSAVGGLWYQGGVLVVTNKQEKSKTVEAARICCEVNGRCEIDLGSGEAEGVV